MNIAIVRSKALSFVLLVVCTLSISLTASMPAWAQFNFTDRSDEANITFRGESYGSSWGDVNNDGLPDIFVTHHREAPSLYVNNGNETFTDTVNDVIFWRQKPFLDQHGAAWGDFNKDGFQDLWVTLGASDNNQFMVNNNGLLVNEVEAYGLEYRTWPGRHAVWLDADGNGTLDATIMQRGRAFMFSNNGTGFTSITNTVNIRCDNNQWANLADLNGDDREELICAGQSRWPQKIYDLTTTPYTDITSILPQVTAVNDAITGDFNNDGVLDFFLVRGTLRPSDAAIITPLPAGLPPSVLGQVQAHLVTDFSREETFTFQSTGVISVYLEWNARNRTRIKIGSAGVNPTGFGGNDPILFDLDPSDPDTWGLQAHNPAVDEGMYMGYDPSTETWTFSASPGNAWTYTYWVLDSTAPVSNLTISGPGGAEDGLPPALLLSGPGGHTEQAAARGLGAKTNCVSAAAADFDNDMDEDIYVVCRDGVTNLANRLYENTGDGNFIEVPGAGGAQGIVGYNEGRGENVTTGDYDLNGFIDLYVTNGLNLRPSPPISFGGDDLLIANDGNGNAWIELELLGTSSNASAVGAKVTATAGGKTQYREQNGGHHRWAQNHQRLHFGLAGNSTVDITIRWPNGLVEDYDAMPANAVYKFTEGGGYSEIVPPSGPQPTLSIDDVTASELDGNASFTVTLSGTTAENVTVDYASIDGSASSPDDYSPVTGNFLFTPGGETSKTIDVTIINDGDAEGTEDFTIELSNETNAILAKSVGTGTIIDDDVIACGAPVYDAGTEAGVFLWEDCDTGNWILRSTAGGVFSNNIGTITSEENFVGNVVGFSVEPHDQLNLSDPKVISFNFKAWVSSQDGFEFAIVGGTPTCVELSPASSVAAVEVGAARVPINGPFDLLSQGPCTNTDPDPDPDVTVGQPTYGPTDTGFYVWKTAGDVWHIRSTAGGTFAAWTGSLTSDLGVGESLAITPFSIEGHDTFDTSDPTALNFTFKIWGTAEDGLDFTFPAGRNVCVNLTAPAGGPAIVGAGNTVVSTPFDLNTLLPCTP